MVKVAVMMRVMLILSIVGGDDISDDNDEGIGYNGEEEGGVTCAKVSKSWMNLASFIKKHNLTDCAGEELINLLGEQKEKDMLPSSIYKLKKALHLDVVMIKYCSACYKEVKEVCEDETHSGICRLMILPFEEKMKAMYEGMLSLPGNACINVS